MQTFIECQMSATNVNRNALHYLMNREAANVLEFK